MGGSDRTAIYAIGTWNSPCANSTPADPFSPPATLFAPGQAPRLWQTADGGVTWKDRTARVLEALNLPDDGGGEYDDFLAFTAVAAAPDDPDIVIVAGYNRGGEPIVVASGDGGKEFTWLGCNALGGIVLCAAISPEVDGARQIAVGTSDAVSGGRIWRYEVDGRRPAHWIDTSDWDGWLDNPLWASDSANINAVTSIAFSPNYASDRSVLAIAMALAGEPGGDRYTGFYLVAGVWDSTGSWNQASGLDNYPVLVRAGADVIHAPSNPPEFLLRGLTSLALPSDFNGGRDVSRVALVAVNGMRVNPSTGSVAIEGGFLFWVQDDAISTEMLGSEDNPWTASVAYWGTLEMQGKMLVGTAYPPAFTWDDILEWFDTGSPALPCCGGVDVLYSMSNDACCPRWERAGRPPSGQFNAQVAWSINGDAAYASTSGCGRLWIDGNWYGDESAFSTSAFPDKFWEQTGLVDTMIHRLVDMAYDPATDMLRIHTQHDSAPGRICCCESIWRTEDQGATWVRELYGNPEASQVDEDAFDDIMNGYYRGFYDPVTEGYVQVGDVGYLIGDAIDADDEEQVQQDFAAGAIYRRTDDAGGWEAISELVLNYHGLLSMTCSGPSGAVLYAGFDNLWWDYTVDHPLPYQPDGSDPVCPDGHDCRKVSGAARLLDAELADCCGDADWDYLIRGLRGTTETDGIYEQLVLSGANCSDQAIRLWAIDDGNGYWSAAGDDSASYDWCSGEFSNDQWGRLWTYADCYAANAVTVSGDVAERTVPSDSCSCANEAFPLEWQRMCDACEYEIQIAFDRQFTQIAVETDAFIRGVTLQSTRFYRPPQPEDPGVLIDKGTLQCGQTYWWRVRAHLAETGEVIASRWSTPERFYTAPGPPGQIELSVPGDGVTGMPVKDIGFTWTAVAQASRYDFLLVDSNRAHVASQVGDFTAFVLPLTLDYDSAYTWRVIALDGDRIITESPRRTFRTMPEPRTLENSVGPSFVLPQVAPARYDWIWYFAGAVGLLLALALGALSHVNRRMRRERDASRHFPATVRRR